MGQSRGISRTRGNKYPKKVFRVFTEGITEVEYVKALKELDNVRNKGAITIEGPAQKPPPGKMFQLAEERAKNQNVDRVFCIVDVEAPKPHDWLSEAQALHRSNPKIEFIFSNPCFEIWIVMHYHYVSSYATNRQAESNATATGAYLKKHITDSQALMNRIDTAMKHADRVRRSHGNNNKVFPKDNPMTDMDIFVNAII